MTKKTIPTPAELHKMLRYEPETGNLYWRERTPDMFEPSTWCAQRKCKTWNARFSGKPAGYINVHGYIMVSVNYVDLLAHRIIWVMVHGKEPADEVDHIDGARANNREENLRDTSHSGNQRNKAIMKNNTSGCHGVHYSTTEQKWKAAINHNGKKKTLGRFNCITAAIIARKTAEVEYGYHANHGKIL